MGTSSHKQAFDLKVSQNQELFSLFDAIVVGDHPSILHGKPSPDIFQEAARQIGNPEPSSCLVFEDAPVGVEAATRAGMHVSLELLAKQGRFPSYLSTGVGSCLCWPLNSPLTFAS